MIPIDMLHMKKMEIRERGDLEVEKTPRISMEDLPLA